VECGGRSRRFVQEAAASDQNRNRVAHDSSPGDAIRLAARMLYAPVKMARSVAFLFAVLITFSAAGDPPPPMPPGTSQFFGKHASDVIAADDGGVWVALAEGIVHYTAAGGGTVLPVAGGAPYRLARAADGSIWYANQSGIGRISTAGLVLEQHSVTGILAIGVASDGALWYLRDYGSTVGRIAGDTQGEFNPPVDAWSLASAGSGAMWLLDEGFGTSTDFLRRMAPDGTVTTYPTGADVLFGRLQALPDGTLYVGTGIRYSLLRLRAGSPNFALVPGFHDYEFLADGAGGVWSSSYSVLHYSGANGASRFSLQLPYDPRETCYGSTPVWAYHPLAVDAQGGLWLSITDEAGYIPLPFPCLEPEPPEMPTLIRINAAALIAAQAVHEVPLSPAVLVTLAALLGAMGMSLLRAS
jgi:streptogramin lyase